MTDELPGGSTQSRDALLAQRFVALADTLCDDYDMVDLLDRLVMTCLEVFEMTAAGILLSDQRGVLHLMASSSEQTGTWSCSSSRTTKAPASRRCAPRTPWSPRTPP
jgi:uncharacterized protein YigA (DUF484 family)